MSIKKVPRKKLSSYVGASIPEQLEILICKPKKRSTRLCTDEKKG